jgi:putative SOS response-associated peptidase YedK
VKKRWYHAFKYVISAKWLEIKKDLVAPADYGRWLSEESDPRDLMRPFPAHLMRMWPISTGVNKPENDDPSIIVPTKLTT